MAYDEGLATRLRDMVPALTEKRMFGGLAFLLNGNMTVGVLGEALIVRLSVDEATDALREPGARPFRFHRAADEGLADGRPGRVRRG